MKDELLDKGSSCRAFVMSAHMVSMVPSSGPGLMKSLMTFCTIGKGFSQ